MRHDTEASTRRRPSHAAGRLAARSGTSLLFLAGLGATAARIGGARAWVGAARVLFWGAAAMAATAAVGAWFGAVV